MAQNSPDARPALPYTRLAEIYDHIMGHVDYRRWARYIRNLLKKEGCWPPDSLLDVGCGTGRFLQEFGKNGPLGDGCDPSRAMLDIAQKRLPASKLTRDAFPDLSRQSGREYPLITCLYDTMNYVPEQIEVIRSLNRTFELLAPGGLFIFDVVSRAHCQKYFQHFSDSEVISKELAYERESYFDHRTDLQHNWIRIFTREGIFEESHQQRIYPLRWLREAITGYTELQIRGIFEEFSMEPANRSSGRVHFVLKKPH